MVTYHNDIPLFNLFYFIQLCEVLFICFHALLIDFSPYFLQQSFNFNIVREYIVIFFLSPRRKKFKVPKENNSESPEKSPRRKCSKSQEENVSKSQEKMGLGPRRKKFKVPREKKFKVPRENNSKSPEKIILSPRRKIQSTQR